MSEEYDDTIIVGQTLDLSYYISENQLENSNEITFCENFDSKDKIKYSENLLFTPDDDDAGETYTFEIGEKELSIKVTDVPVSVVENTKFHWPMLKRSNGTIIETEEDEDGTAVGTTNVSGDWWEGFAEENDGTSDNRIETTTWQDFGSNDLLNDWCIFWTMETTDGDNKRVWGERTESSTASEDQIFVVRIGTEGSEGELDFLWRKWQGDFDDIRIYTNERFDDGKKYQIALNKTGNSASDIEFWANGEQVDVTISEDSTRTDSTDFSDPVWLTHASRGGSAWGNPIDAYMDSFRVVTDSISENDIKAQYNAQPWS